MPQIIRTPDEIFRQEEKDIYFIRFRDQEGNSAAREEIRAWLRENTPGARVESLAPPEDSGYICGYFGDLRVDFSESDLTKYCARWEDGEGTSLDTRMQCFLSPYKDWFAKHGHFIPTLERPTGLGPSKWWDTPLGVVYHQIAADPASGEKVRTHPAQAGDIWMHAVRLWPGLAALDTSTLTHGHIYQSADGKWAMEYSDSPFNPFAPERAEELRAWFNLPQSAKIYSEW